MGTATLSVGPVQNENTGSLLCMLSRISRWQQQAAAYSTKCRGLARWGPVFLYRSSTHEASPLCLDERSVLTSPFPLISPCLI